MTLLNTTGKVTKKKLELVEVLDLVKAKLLEEGLKVKNLDLVLQ